LFTVDNIMSILGIEHFNQDWSVFFSSKSVTSTINILQTKYWTLFWIEIIKLTIMNVATIGYRSKFIDIWWTNCSVKINKLLFTIYDIHTSQYLSSVFVLIHVILINSIFYKNFIKVIFLNECVAILF
jgi:hypothetical protein